MCGIAGAVGDFEPAEASAVVASMVSALRHRGPDDEGIRHWELSSGVVALGNTRLSILDLSSAGHQPMTERSGRYWTVYNGEIYNFLELRRILDAEQQLFITGTDTEVILQAFRRWSVQAFTTFRGMFAFALFDREEGAVYLVRDSLGIKPLYYHISGEKLLFASEVGALLASEQIPRRIDRSGIAHFLQCGWIGNAGTAISGIRMLPPGHVLRADLGGSRMTWKTFKFGRDFQFEGEPPESDRNESEAHVLHLLEQSVKYHLVSDVPVGLFLSGGIDSTALLHLMRNVGRGATKTFTVVFDEKDFSERDFARRVAESCHAEHQELELSESDLYSRLPSAMEVMDQPTMDGVNTFVVAQAVKAAGVKVALSGLGADELFAGYPSFRRVRLAGMAVNFPFAVRKAIAAIGRTILHGPSIDKTWDLLESKCTPSAAYDISRRLFTPTEIGHLMQLIPFSSNSDPLPDSIDQVNQMSRLELRGYMTDLLLRDTDFMSMASSLEVRVPFVDETLIRYVLQLPGRWKISSSHPKPLLLRSMRGAIPDYVWNRRKMGFVLPLDRWMKAMLRQQMEAVLSDSELARSVGLAPGATEKVWRGFLEGRLRWSKPWSLFVLLSWCKRNHASV